MHFGIDFYKDTYDAVLEYGLELAFERASLSLSFTDRADMRQLLDIRT